MIVYLFCGGLAKPGIQLYFFKEAFHGEMGIQ